MKNCGQSVDQAGRLEDVLSGVDQPGGPLVGPVAEPAGLLGEQPADQVLGDRRAVVGGGAWWRTHCQTCIREISTVAASSIRLSIATAPAPPTQAARYSRLTRMLVRTPSTVTAPRVRADVE